MAQVALNSAPGSTDNLLITTSPEIIAELFKVSKLFTINSPENSPSISALLHSTLPFILPDLPITTRPIVFIVPSTFPSILKSPSEIISPTNEVFFPMIFLSDTCGCFSFFSEKV